MSKAKNKAQVQRIQRRVLNKTLDFFRGISGRRLTHGDGLRRGQVLEDVVYQTLEDELDEEEATDAIERHFIDRNRQDTYRRAGF
ncbi:MAG: hypothetical protein EOQ39_18590 [Mesorhizobium sp.]|uniref:hypothetical protein n=1 Tax=Mesorhizobium sp. TaxID=1871066 RepID=UPI000FE9B121|nr:hypothetical protein [Mesorhizobium sp.]RWB08821.1 MAG: hypothetical protein EOQ37_04755 [Mesorhizobium sp.]RWB13529.1 MAG: hypothetical protein EOQ39_18590 [Mesorhizobium sp.]